MSKLNWYVVAGIALIVAFALGLLALILGFHRTYDTLFYLLVDLTFLPIQVLLVTLVINRLLQIRERTELEQKVNIVIGIFFSEMGNELLRYFSLFDTHLEEMREIVQVKPNWTNRDFAMMRKRLDQHKYTIDCRCADLNDLKRLLEEKREFALGILANPSLLENVSFTQLLWAIAHLAQELELRPDLDHLPDSDYDHLGNDMRRAYVLTVMEWLSYVRRLRDRQPYMLSLIVRMNPFSAHPSAVVEKDEKPANDS